METPMPIQAIEHYSLASDTIFGCGLLCRQDAPE